MIDENSNFIKREEDQGNIKGFNDIIKLAIKGNEAIAATDAALKDRLMVVCGMFKTIINLW